MEPSKNKFTLFLMAFSIVLLLVLQFLWLRSSYQNEREQLRREASLMFRSTIFSLQDSMIQRRIKFIPADSGERQLGLVRRWRGGKADSLFKEVELSQGDAHLKVIVSSESPDSLPELWRPLTDRMQSGQRNFVIRFDRDSLNLDSVNVKFEKVLSRNSTNLSFTVHKLRRGEELLHDRELVLDPVRLPPFDRYTATFDDPRSFLLRKISPQILFSIFLSLLTTSAFILMFISLRSQQNLMNLKNDFISNVTHELKTPVATVSVAIEALKNFEALHDPVKVSEYLNIAQQELARLTSMTDKILKTAIFANEDLSYQIEKIDLIALTRHVITSVGLIAEKQGAAISFEADDDEFFIQGDAGHLTTMFYNLLDNALKYSPSQATIKIVLKRVPHEICLSVHDNGIGISPEYHKKIFEKFFRVPFGDVHNARGYGLGLSYVAGVVKKHKGRISIESAPDKGSSFFIYFPDNHG